MPVESADVKAIEQSTEAGGKPSSFGTAGAVVLLAVMAVLAGGAALRESVTIDEVAHIGAGLSYVQKLDLRMNEEHPPLAKVLAGASLAAGGGRADYSNISWTESAKFFSSFLGEWVFGDWTLTHWNSPQRALVFARIPMLLITLALGWVIFACGRRIGGIWGGLLCLMLYVTAPVFLAFGPLVLTDTAITLFSLMTVWAFADMWHSPTPRNVWVFGLALAAALLSKFSAGILLFAVLLFTIVTRWWPVGTQPVDIGERSAWRKLRWRGVRRGILIAAAVVYAFYIVFSWNQPLDIPGLSKLGMAGDALGRLLMPQWLFFRGLAIFLLTSTRPTFILGHAYSHGVWFYFPVVFALKSATGYVALLALGVVLALSWRIARRRITNLPVLIPGDTRVHWRVASFVLVVVTSVCMLSPMTISVRHFSVPIVLVTLLVAPLPRLLAELRARRPLPGIAATALTAILAVSCIYSAVRAYPNYIPYINALSFGHPVYELVNDSNVDWNQALPEVQKFVEQHQLTDIPLDDYGFSDVRAIVPKSTFWNCQAPVAGDAGKWVAVSANMLLDTHRCTWLLAYPHETVGGGSMYLVHLPASIPPAGAAGGPPTPDRFRQFPGVDGGPDFRLTFLEAIWDPSKLPAINAKLMEEFQQQQAKKK